MKSKDEIGEELCEYCEIPKESQGVKSYGGEPSFCMDSGRCDAAYEAYKDAHTVKTKEELGSDLCEYCDWWKESHAPGSLCEGCCCDSAYESYLEDIEERNEIDD